MVLTTLREQESVLKIVVAVVPRHSDIQSTEEQSSVTHQLK